MKTADLIPFILLELNECDKYGFELTKAIETKSNGKIVIKQPTLYTLLKKLEKSKFIASYWQDSEIGGKRHYYKLTENGRLQVSTLPSYDFLLKNALSEEIDDKAASINTIQENYENKFSIMDELLNSSPTPMETILPTEEVFSENNIDVSTEYDLNVSNAEILKHPNETVDEKFANNIDVMKFTEKVASAPDTKVISNNQISTNFKELFDVKFELPKNETKITYVDYVNIKNSEEYKYSKKISKRLLFQALSTSACLVAMLLILSIITFYTSRSALFYIFFIGAILIALFYPILYLINMEKIRLKFKSETYKPKTKLKLFLGLTLLLIVLIVCIVVSLCVGNNSFSLIFGIKNFANFYAPILLSLTYFVDVLFNHMYLSKIN